MKISIDYIILIFLISLLIIFSIILLSLSYIFVFQQNTKSKSSSYECGFQPFTDARSKFNIKYYLIAILFIIFDLELIYMLPWVFSLIKLNFFSYYVMILFLFILTIGFIFEWGYGALEWD